MISKDLDLIKIAELMNHICPIANVESINFNDDDFIINFSISYNDFKGFKKDNNLIELKKLIDNM